MMDTQIRGENQYTQHNLTRVLKCDGNNDTIPTWFLKYLESEARALQMQLNDIARMLGKNPKRCEHCGGEIR